MTRLSLASLALALALSAATTGCAGASPGEPEYPEQTPQSRSEQISEHRAALSSLRKSPFAGEAAGDLGKAESWLGQAERLQAEDEEDGVDLLLEAVRGQLAMVQSFYSRRESEVALERVRADYERRRKSEADLARKINQITNTELGE